MIKMQYTLEQKNEDDTRVFQIMRAKTVQEAIDQIGITDPPRSRKEYNEALKVFRSHILHNQPFALAPNISFDEACTVNPRSNTSIFARGAIYQWAYVALIATALEENYQEAIAGLMGVWETSCQFSDDLFAMGTKLCFAVGSVMLKIPVMRPMVNSVAWTVLGFYYGDTIAPRVLKHDYKTHELNVDLFLLLQFLSKTEIANLAHELVQDGVSLESFAAEFDKKTAKQFRMQEWVKTSLNS